MYNIGACFLPWERRNDLMDTRNQQILMILLEKEYVPTQELSITMSKTNRTMRTYLKELNQIIEKHGALIKNVYGKGNHLEILDEEKFIAFMSNIDMPYVDYNNQDHRILEILTILFFRVEYIKQEELCDCFYLSLKQIKEDLKKVKMILQLFHLNLDNKSHYGMKISGNEIDKRYCMIYIDNLYDHHFLESQIHDFNKKQDAIESIILSCIANKSYHISQDNLNHVSLYLVLAIERFSHHYFLDTHEDMNQNAIAYTIAKNVTLLIDKVLNIQLSVDELQYLAIQLISKENKILENNQSLPMEMNQLISHMLFRIKNYFGVTLINDFDLMISLGLHLEPLLSRIRYRTFIHNPLTNEIKTKLCQSYEMALVACEVLNEKYHVILPEDEVAFITLHIDLAYENNLALLKKKNIVIIYSNSAATARLLKLRFEKEFHQFLNHIDLINVIDFKENNLQNYDYIFTTISLNLQTQIPVIKIDSIMNENDYSLIENHLNQTVQIKKYFPKQFFFPKFDCQNKQDCIHQLITQITQEIDLTDQFEKLIMRREELGSTEFGSTIALPHPLYPIINQSFFAIAILKRAIDWNKHKVRIVILMSVSNLQNIVELDELYHIISIILSQKVLQSQLIRCASYEQALESIEAYL